MTGEREFLDRVQNIFQEALDLDPASRDSYLTQACAGDDRLHSRVAALLGALETADASQAWNTTAIHQLATELFDADLDRYRLLERIGSGGMGVVHKAVRADDAFSKLVAVKIVLIPDPALIHRFRRERQILAGLEHPNIARLLDGGTSKTGAPFLVMEYIDGIPIHRYVEQKKLAVPEILALVRKVCAAVSYAHRKLVIHRDLKPGNILVTPEGEPKLLDFGIAKLMDETGERTRTGLVALTPEYASPEQIRGESITTATDVYSLGVLLYEMLTGSRPYRPTESQLQLAEVITKDSPLTLNAAGKRFHPDLENIVQMALRKEPERRYASVDQFSDDIRRHVEGLPVLAHRDTLAYRADKFVRRHALAVAAAGIVLITLIAGIAGTAWQAHVARQQRARAERRFNDVRKLADSFLFEFNDSIEGVPGTLAARQLILKRAMEYLDSLAQESGGDPGLQSELADAYNKLGTITFDVEARLGIHRKELAMRESVARSAPQNVSYQQHLAQTYISVGDATKDTGNLRGALENYRRALAVSRPLPKRAPADPSLQLDIANALELIGQILDRMGNLDEALANQNQALLALRNAMSNGAPNRDYPQLMMVIHHNIARELTKKGDLKGAMEQTQEGLRLAEQMNAENPSDATNRRNIWVCHMRIAELLVKSGDPAGGLARYRKALPFIQDLSEADPGDKGHRRALAFTYLSLADALAATSHREEAFRDYQIAIATSEALLAVDPNKLETRADLASMYTHLGMLYMQTRQRREASQFLQKGRVFFDAASAADPANADIQRGKAQVYAQLDRLKSGM